MHTYRLEIRKLKTAEYQSLRKTTGWSPLTDIAVAEALERDLFSVCVYHHQKVIGMARVIGDGAIYFYIQDVVVLPEYQGKGVGALLMNAIEKYLEKTAGNNAFIGLMAAERVKEFYKKYGYTERPVNGPGMYKTIKKPQ